LLHDIKEIQLHPLPNVRAIPLETDIFQWHVVLIPPPRTTEQERKQYPFTGIRFHMIMKFPEE
jgi:ubiquitin-protein ligase